MNDPQDFSNQLINETSPYLLQHAHNPVDWYPWGPAALEKARGENKPILLSIGYSACHWCHVMAHESFEDPATAELMNRLFVNIKVDREERPDLDKIYQTSHSLLTRRNGGWPLTVFLTPDDHVPFFAGTYFPNEPRHGMPSFQDLMQRIVAFLDEHGDDIRKQNTSLVNALAAISNSGSHAAMINSQPLDVVRQQLEQNFDEGLGGFGSAPKFPHPTNIERLLRHWAGTEQTGMADQRALHMAIFTLEKMAQGGLYDHLGGGFCRYSVDDRWMIPHFEKMLYDNGALLALYAEACVITGSTLFRRTCEQTAAWSMREMQSDSGGYYSSQDADSEGEEGRFYVWTPAAVQVLLDDDEYRLFARHFGLDKPANFEGKWHLHTYVSREQLADDFSLDIETVNTRIDSACDRLFTSREQRVRPGRDDKVLTSWNGLMIRGMAMAGRLLDRPDWTDSAVRAVDFIHDTLWRDGRLLATYKDGRAHLNAYLDDHVYLVDALLELLQARWRDRDLAFAIELAEVLLAHFQDDAGGFFFTSDDHEQLIQRPKPNHDDATPSGNGIAAKVLARLGHLLGDSRYLEAAGKTLQALWPSIEDTPYGHTSLLLALEESFAPGQTIVLRGDVDAMQSWRAPLDRAYAPRRLVFSIPADATALAGVLAERKPLADVTAYLCEGLSCQAPVTDKTEFDKLMKTDP
ncbi:MAG: thioredoxin domain-containing protein [Pseudomonadota bacterium]